MASFSLREFASRFGFRQARQRLFRSGDRCQLFRF
jgi:hypothetical protein